MNLRVFWDIILISYLNGDNPQILVLSVVLILSV